MKTFPPPCFLPVLFCSVVFVTPAHPAEIPIIQKGVEGRMQAPTPPAPTMAAYQDRSPSSISSDPPFVRVDSLYRDNWYRSSILLVPTDSLFPPPRISFPAVPPVLGDPLPSRSFGVIRLNDIEAQLSPYTNELFYAPLAGLFNQEDLSHRRRQKLETYRALHDQLLRELRSHIEAQQDAPSDLRREDFARLAAQQASRLTELADQAEKLRADFVHGGIFSTGIDWNDTRDWRLGDDLAFESLQDEARVARGAAYFQDGLSEGQRQLLREVAIELAQPVGQPSAGLELDQPKPFVFFSPATARVRLPYNLPDDLAQKIESYTAAKAELKRELREVIYAKDSAWLNLSRTRALKALAKKQAPRIAELDIRAEDIREQWASLPDATRPGSEELPMGLIARIRRYLAQKQAVENAYLAKLGEVRSALVHDRVELVQASGTLTISHTPSPGSRKTTAQSNAAREELAAFNAQHNELMRGLEKEKEAIQNEAAALLRQKYPLLNQVPIAVLLSEYGKFFEWEATWQRYSEYRTAVLEPGLSPAQRRLLYGAALEKLRLPPTS